jgi:hippurate hydrolase
MPTGTTTATGELADVYRDLHRHPKLSFAETRTAGMAADRLRATGFHTATDVGGTGAVGLLRNRDGLTALLRAAVDALPTLERTGLLYASTRTRPRR